MNARSVDDSARTDVAAAPRMYIHYNLRIDIIPMYGVRMYTYPLYKL